MKRISTLAVAALTLSFFAMPAVSSATALTQQQVSAVIGLLQAFGVDQTVVSQVEQALGVISADPLSVATSSPVSVVPLTRPDTSGSPYASSNLGYDLSFNTRDYPQIPFGFVVVGVTAGKAYLYNERARSEYSFAQFGSTRPTLYLNLNAPYGSTATSTNMSAPHFCNALFGAATTSVSAGGTYLEPTVCASYNYGYNAAKGAYAYATGAGISAPLWWLDIEEANSWSSDTAVNDAVMQGAIDYLNSKNIRAGIYSVPFMWHNIAGDSFSPTQSLSGASDTTPTWFPIGIATQVRALNACLTGSFLIPGSPVWIIQYEANSTAVDQNIAC